MGKRNWSKEDEQRLLYLRDVEGRTIDEMVVLLGKTRGSVSSKVTQMIEKGYMKGIVRGRRSIRLKVDFEQEEKTYESLGCLCKYMNCNKYATSRFAQVALCELHYEMIREETHRYYKSRGQHPREHYSKIDYLIGWSKTMLELKREGRQP
jgi:hypothetical protein